MKSNTVLNIMMPLSYLISQTHNDTLYCPILIFYFAQILVIKIAT